MSIALLVAQCKNPFATREAEPPIGGRTPWIPPSSPTLVLANLRNAIAGKSVDNYLRCLSGGTPDRPSFTFIPDQGVASLNPGFFDRWGIAHEENYLRQLFAVVPDDSLHKLELELVSENSFPDSAVIVQNYVLTAHHTLRDPSYPRQARGQAEFRLFLDQQNGYWYIWRWHDTGTAQAPSWSTFKAVFGK
ncbi:MAG: hypothetical protein ONB30_05100 [candidate division KSB1 bacterium]|nr:hypothetical protein [candidate division KSB1 bacterium]